MSKTSYSILHLVILTLITLGSCTSKSKQYEESDMTEYESMVTPEDSAEVIRLVNMFFESIEAGHPETAAEMLYKVNPDDSNQDPQLLDNDEMQKVFQLLSAFPIIAHRIEYIKFHEAHNNEVQCSAIMVEAIDDIPEVKTIYYLKPIEHLGRWYLCLMNSATGNNTIVDSNARDSIAQTFKQ